MNQQENDKQDPVDNEGPLPFGDLVADPVLLLREAQLAARRTWRRRRRRRRGGQRGVHVRLPGSDARAGRGRAAGAAGPVRRSRQRPSDCTKARPLVAVGTWVNRKHTQRLAHCSVGATATNSTVGSSLRWMSIGPQQNGSGVILKSSVILLKIVLADCD